jgi:triacylglycerol lipase
VHDNAADLGVDPTRIAVHGESAGGCLAASLCFLARDRGEVAVRGQVLVYPMLDDRSPSEPHPHAGEFVWTRTSNDFGWQAYLGPGAGGPEAEVGAVPARRTDLAGLPPTFVAVGALDLFLEEDLEFARRLTRAGVPVELHVYPGAYHGFPRAGDTSVARRLERDVRDALVDMLELP